MSYIRLDIGGSSPCERCHGACCRYSGVEYAVLLEGDEERRRFAAYSQGVRIEHEGRVSVQQVLTYRDGRCIFLDENNSCLIYDDRPVNCRRFECITGFGQGGGEMAGHSNFLQRNPQVLKLLESL